MKAIPMRGRLTGKRIGATIWAGAGAVPLNKERYFQVQDDRLVSADFQTPSGRFRIRCRGASCEVKLFGPEGHTLGTHTLLLPHGVRRLSTGDVARVPRRRRKRAKARRSAAGRTRARAKATRARTPAKRRRAAKARPRRRGKAGR